MTGPVAVPEQQTLIRRGHLSQFVDRARNRATPIVARRRRGFVCRALTSAATLYLDMVGNVCYEIERNGELRVLRELQAVQPECVFDVGANIGDWSIAAASLFPTAQIHAFEIVPDTAQVLRERLTRVGAASVTVSSTGLSDENGTVKVAYLPGFPEGSSAAVVQPASAVQWRECAVQTGGNYCLEHRISHIDFLKLDVEGFEARVLKGFDGMLADGKIDVVQFEYGHINASVRFLLGDFYDLFDRYGYVVGKIYPDAVDFRAYNAWTDEDFRGPNYLAVRRDDTRLIQRLTGNSA